MVRSANQGQQPTTSDQRLDTGHLVGERGWREKGADEEKHSHHTIKPEPSLRTRTRTAPEARPTAAASSSASSFRPAAKMFQPRPMCEQEASVPIKQT